MEQAKRTWPENKSCDWADIVAHYQDLTTYGCGYEMLALVQHIISSGAADRLFAHTSHATLKVSIYESMPSRREELQIDFDGKVFLFDYFATDDVRKQPEFHRKYLPEAGIEKFDQFLRWIRW